MISKLLVNWLIPGDVIRLDRKDIPVKTIERCPSTRRGIPKYHVNGSLCLDTISPLLGVKRAPIRKDFS